MSDVPHEVPTPSHNKLFGLAGLIAAVIAVVFVVGALLYNWGESPAFDRGDRAGQVLLTDEEISSLPVAFRHLLERSVPPKWNFAVEKTVPSSPKLLERGAALFKDKCATCHGPEGRGKSAMKDYLVAKLPDFSLGLYKYQSNTGRAPSDADLFRTITNGFPRSGMPAFDFLSVEDRFALVHYLKKKLGPQDGGFVAGPAIPDPPALVANRTIIERGKALYAKWKCVECHGPEGKGDGERAKAIAVKPTNFTEGPSEFKTGHRAEDVFRVIYRGIPPAGMPSYSGFLTEGYTANDLMAVSLYIEQLALQGEEKIRRGWHKFARQWREEHPEAKVNAVFPDRFDPKISKKFDQVKPEVAKAKGCLACHSKIHMIEGDTGKMGEAILAMAGGEQARTCVVCHDGQVDGHTKEKAHRGMFPNPGSLWVVAFGKGCAKCHSGGHGLSSLHGVEFPLAMAQHGPMQVVSKTFDPSGATGHSHVYRTMRGQMSLEHGKATYALQASGFISTEDYAYADFKMDDPLGKKPIVGTETYKKWVAWALKNKVIVRNSITKPFPTLHNIPDHWKKKPQTHMISYYRKSCGRCHLWNPGRRVEGEFRSDGCSACHVLYDRDGLYKGHDPTIPRNIGGHPVKHNITAKIPSSQCARCHMAIYKHGRLPAGTKSKTGMGPEVHLDKGMECIDCHTSIDLHGDGNIYTSLQYQVEIRCSDCHGTADKYPWELAIGDWRKGGEARGVYRQKDEDGKVIEYLLTSRGNPRSNFRKEGKEAYIKGFLSGKKHKITFLKDKAAARRATGKKEWKNKYGEKVTFFHSNPHVVQKHTKLECYACHSRMTSSCKVCHIKRKTDELSDDYIMSGTRFNPRTGRVERFAQTEGKYESKELKGHNRQPFRRMGLPVIRKSLRGTYKSYQPTCIPIGSTAGKKGINYLLIQHSFLGTPVPHEFSRHPRQCNECHVNGPGSLEFLKKRLHWGDLEKENQKKGK